LKNNILIKIAMLNGGFRRKLHRVQRTIAAMPRRIFLLLFAAVIGALLMGITALLAFRADRGKQQSMLWHISEEETVLAIRNLSPDERELLSAILVWRGLPLLPEGVGSATLLTRDGQQRWMTEAEVLQQPIPEAPLARSWLLQHTKAIIDAESSWIIVSPLYRSASAPLIQNGAVLSRVGTALRFALPLPHSLRSPLPLPTILSPFPSEATIVAITNPEDTFPALLSLLPQEQQDTVEALARTAIRKHFGTTVAIPADLDPLLGTALLLAWHQSGSTLTYVANFTADPPALHDTFPRLHETFRVSLPRSRRVQRQLSPMWAADYVEEDPNLANVSSEEIDGWALTATEASNTALFSAQKGSIGILSNSKTALKRSRVDNGAEIPLPQILSIPPAFLAGGFLPSTSALALLRLLGLPREFEQTIAKIQKAESPGIRWSLTQGRDVLYGAIEF
jgi:hypothetical protein